MRELLRSAYFIVTVDEELRLVRRTRTEHAFPSLAEVVTAWESVFAAVEPLDRKQHVLLVDLRLSRPRNDADFEKLVEQYAPRLFSGFRRTAVLVKTHAGRLQIMRLHKDTLSVQAFVDESAAIAYLTGNET